MTKKILALITASMTMAVLCSAPAVAFAQDGDVVKKDETVYVVTDSSGCQEDVIVSDHLVNKQQLKKISDRTTLSDIENVKGDEKFKQKGDSIEWYAEGNDIYYQGKTDKEAPVTVSVTYKLNGKAVSGKKLQGKSGNVEINISYKNNGRHEGKTVPFVVLTGLIVTDNSFTDIKIDHGKVIDAGDKQVAVGMAAPGLAEGLDVAEADLGFGDSVKITGKASKFAVKDMMTLATSSFFEDVNTGNFDLDYDDEIKQLNDGAKKLNKGSRSLSQGINKLSDKLKSQLKDVISGMESIEKGLKSMKTKIDYVDSSEIPQNPGLNQAAEIAESQSNTAKAKAASAYATLSGIDTTEMTTEQIAAIETAKADAAAAATAGGTAEKYLQGVESGITAISGSLGDTSSSRTLIGGVSYIRNGLQKSVGNNGELSKGLLQLSEGAEELSDGMNLLYEDGIRKIVDLYNDELKGLVDGAGDLIDAGKGYNTFTELPSGMDGSVKFIYKTRISR